MTFDSILVFSLISIFFFHKIDIFPSSITNSWLIVGGIIATIPVVINACKALYRKKISVDLLASIALVFSIVNQEWESVVFIDLMITCARIFGSYTERKARFAIQSLLKLRPEKVNVKRGKDIVVVPLSEVIVGDLVVVESGNRIPVDGVVVKGQASIDQSSLTGESMPIFKHEGDQVLSATLNVSGSLIMRVEKVGKDTTFEKIVLLIEESAMGKASIQTSGEQFATWYIFFTLAIALVLFFFSRDIKLVLSVLLVTCADDIAVAVPMVFWAAVGYAAKRGIIVKGGNYLEGLTKVKTLVVDKTGTLTKGIIAVHAVVAFGKHTENDVLTWAAYTSSVSEHPLAKAIVLYNKHKNRKAKEESPEVFREFPGKGVVAQIRKIPIVAGNMRLMEEERMSFSYEELHKIRSYNNKGLTTIMVAYDGKPIGFIALADELRDDIKWTVSNLKRHGVERIVMLTGDNEFVAKRVAEEIGISEYHANMLPEDKVAFVRKNLSSQKKLAMVGDGVNDAAALALSDIGISMGAIGSDAAIESSDVALMKDDFSKVSEAIVIGAYAVRVAREDFIIWGVVNAVGLGLVFGGVIGPTGAALFNFVTDFLPILNSLRLFRYHLLPNLRMRI